MKKSFSALKSSAYCRRFALMLLPAAAICFTLGALGCLDILNANRAYLVFDPGDIALPLFGLSLAATVVIAVPAALPRGKGGAVVFGLLCMLALLFYAQGMFLNGNLGTLDGNQFLWQQSPRRSPVDMAIWVAGLGAAVFLSLRHPSAVRSMGCLLCLIILGAQGTALAVSWTGDGTETVYQLSGEDQFVLSPEENIVVITLDQFSPLLMDTQLELDPTLYEAFGDFLYYDNMSANYFYTYPSMCCLLTHERLSYDIPTLDYFYKAWHSDLCTNFYDTLHNDNYNVRIYAETNYIAATAENMLGKADNVAEPGGLIHTLPLIGKSLSVSLFRYLPYMLKNGVYLSTAELNGSAVFENLRSVAINYDFLLRLRSETMTLSDDGKNCFVWYHLQGAHFPYTCNWDGEFVGEGNTDRTSQLHGYLTTVLEYLDNMKELGIYDDATIIISADHGYFECLQTAFLIKPAHHTGDTLTISSAPVSQDDIMPTILAALGEDYSAYGCTVFDVAEDAERERTTCVWGHLDDYPDVAWIGDFDQWNAAANGTERYNVMGELHYIGDRDDVLALFYDWYYYGICDRIYPLYDSFY